MGSGGLDIRQGVSAAQGGENARQSTGVSQAAGSNRGPATPFVCSCSPRLGSGKSEVQPEGRIGTLCAFRGAGSGEPGVPRMTTVEGWHRQNPTTLLPTRAQRTGSALNARLIRGVTAHMTVCRSAHANGPSLSWWRPVSQPRRRFLVVRQRVEQLVAADPPIWTPPSPRPQDSGLSNGCPWPIARLPARRSPW
jgi:hypothetical protein